jgi:glycosyltransferase involved in cell wall biosynthesis
MAMKLKELPFVTIGIPFYNAEAYLLNAIRSVLAQTYENWELILVDDGSTDKSLEIARSIRDPRISLYSDGKNKKLSYRLNEIISLAKYDYIARMDADDMMASNRIEKQLYFLVSNPNYDLVTTGVCSITDDAIPYGIRVPPDSHAVSFYTVLSGKHAITHASIMGRRDWFIRNTYDTSDHWAEDYKLWIRAIERNDLAIGFINEPLYYYREVGSMTTKKMIEGQMITMQEVCTHGPNMIGWFLSSYLLLLSTLKIIIIYISSHFGIKSYIVRSRNKKSNYNMNHIKDDINMIKKGIIKSDCVFVVQN